MYNNIALLTRFSEGGFVCVCTFRIHPRNHNVHGDIARRKREPEIEELAIRLIPKKNQDIFLHFCVDK